MAVNDETIRLILDLQESGKWAEAQQHIERLRTSLSDTDVGMQKVSRSSTAMNQRILELGRATQDFAQGGFAGILNNIERIVGGAGPLAGILTAVGTAAYFSAPLIKEFFTGVSGEKAEDLKRTSKAMEEMNQQIHILNTRTKEQAMLERDLTRAKKERKEQEQAETLEEPGIPERRAEASTLIKGAVGGGYKQVLTGMEEMVEAGYKSARRDFDRLTGAPRGEAFSRMRFYAEMQKRGMTQKILNRAIAGEESAIRASIQLMAPSSEMREFFEQALPEGSQGDKADREFQRQLEERSAQVAERNRRVAERKKKNKVVDDLNRHAQDNQEDTFEKMDKTREEGHRLGRDAGKEWRRMLEKDIANQRQILGERQVPLQMVPKDTDQRQAIQIMLENQAIIGQNQRIDAMQLVAARRLQSDLKAINNIQGGLDH